MRPDTAVTAKVWINIANWDLNARSPHLAPDILRVVYGRMK